MNTSTSLSYQTIENQLLPMLLCNKCKTHIPSVMLKQMRGVIAADIKCNHCQYKELMNLEEYLTLIKKQDCSKHFCTNKVEHSNWASRSYCINCNKWICLACIKDHDLYSDLFKHVKVPKEVMIDVKCLTHRDNQYKYYCKQCNVPLCDTCLVDNKHNDHLVTDKESFWKEIGEININANLQHINNIRNSNKKYKDQFIKLFNLEIEKLQNQRDELLSAYELNEKQNRLINDLLLYLLGNHERLKEHSSFDLINNIINNIVPNKIQVEKLEEGNLENNYLNLKDYWKTNYIVEIMHKVSYPNGDTYDGQLVDRIKQSNNKSLLASRQQCESDHQNDELKGNMTYQEDEALIDEWGYTIKQGYGVYKWANGRQYEGNFHNNKLNGIGKMTFPDGDTYDGEWQNDIKEGYGIYKWIDGQCYEGIIQNNKINGQGKMTYPNGETYDGQWVNDIKQGYGIYKWPDGRQYEGNFKDDNRNINGKMTYPNGESYEGEWVNDTKEGYGIYKWPNGLQYEGNFLNNTKNGKGKMIYPNGEKYNEEWLNGVKQDKTSFIADNLTRIHHCLSLIKNNKY